MVSIISAMVRNSNLAFQSHSSSYALNALLEEEVKQLNKDDGRGDVCAMTTYYILLCAYIEYAK